MILATATQPYCTHKQSAVDCFDFCRRYERPVAIFLFDPLLAFTACNTFCFRP
eukprot:m.418085 g.418085  ORF g.418085 m.418085 type:complete len:53 (-) comp21288_c0_seq56:130-288(-)